MRNLLILSFILSAMITLPNISSAADTNRTSSGLKYIVVKKGTGPKAQVNKMVSVHYEGFFKDGKRFDSSRRRKAPIEFLLGAGHVIKGWDEGIALMNVGDQFKLIIPPSLGYGEKGVFGVIPENATLFFDVELLGISEPKKSLSDAIYEEIKNNGLESGKTLYNDIKANRADEYTMKEDQLNGVGYKLMYDDRKVDEALEVFKWNVEAYPEAFNVYDSLGEAYMMKGDKENAILNYEKSLVINPENEAGKKMLVQLRGY